MATRSGTTSINIVQSVWSRGITDQVMQGRSDTDILSKGSQILENVVMMEQGGLKKRPALQFKMASIASADITYSVAYSLPWGRSIILVNADNNVYLYYPDDNVAITIAGINGRIYSSVQDQNVVLISIQNGTVSKWYDIIFTEGNNTPTVNEYVASAPYLVKTGLTPGLTVAVTKNAIGTGQNEYFYVGETVFVDVFGSPAFVCNFVYIDGLFIKITSSTTTPTDVQFTGTILSSSSINVQASTLVVYNSQNYYGKLTNVKSCIFGEPAWDEDSMPRYITQFQNRLWCAYSNGVDYGFASIPVANFNTIWASSIGDKHEFLVAGTDASDPIAIILAGDVAPQITGLYAGITINAFTENGIYSFLNAINSSITPTNFFIQKQTNHSSLSIKPTEYDQQLFYIQKNGKNIRSLKYADKTLQIDANATIYTPSITNNPINMLTINSLDGDDNSYLFVLNRDSAGQGYISCHQSVQTQEIFGWTKWTFNNAINIKYLVTTNNRFFAITNTNIFEFKNNIYKDNSLYDVKCIIQTNPYSLRDISIGDLLYRRKKIGEINAFVYNTDSVIINGVKYDVNQFDTDYQATKTAIITIFPQINWAKFDYVTIEHNTNNPFALLSLGVKLTL